MHYSLLKQRILNRNHNHLNNFKTFLQTMLYFPQYLKPFWLFNGTSRRFTKCQCPFAFDKLMFILTFFLQTQQKVKFSNRKLYVQQIKCLTVSHLWVELNPGTSAIMAKSKTYRNVDESVVRCRIVTWPLCCPQTVSQWLVRARTLVKHNQPIRHGIIPRYHMLENMDPPS